MKLSLIAAVAANGVIGRGDDLPWRLSDDLRRFKRLTMGHTVIMGRRTYESIGRPLPRRRCVVLSSRPDLDPEGVEVVSSLEAALERCTGEDEVFVIGGRAVYEAALPCADRLYLTEVQAEIEGDVCFPTFDRQEWRVVEEQSRPADDRNEWPVRYRLYERRPSPRD